MAAGVAHFAGMLNGARLRHVWSLPRVQPPPPAAVPDGYIPSPSGLILPESLRTRETWTKDEWRLLDRVEKLMKSRGLKHFLTCGNPECMDPDLKATRDGSGAMVLQCGCKTRYFTKAF